MSRPRLSPLNAHPRVRRGGNEFGRRAWLLAVLLTVGCGDAEAQDVTPAERIAASLAGLPPAPARDDTRTSVEAEAFALRWTQLLQSFATDDGGFRYEALLADPEAQNALNSLVADLARIDPADLGRAAQLAHLINAYNVLVVHSVVTRWPVRRVLDVPGFFDGTTHRVGAWNWTLDALEHGAIRPRFREPRIHFVVNCASEGCPPLLREALTAESLESTLDNATRTYLRRTVQLDASRREIRVTELFRWFVEDWEDEDGVRAFVASHVAPRDAETVLDPSWRLTYAPYDWSINARP